VVNFDENYSVHLINRTSGDTLDVGFPNKYTGLYSFNVSPGQFKIFYKGYGYITQKIDTTILQDNPNLALNIDVSLERDTSIKKISLPLTVYEKINLALIPTVSSVDTSTLIRNLNVSDVGDINIKDSHNPVDVTYFKYITDMKVLYNDLDMFYRYTTGRFSTREDAYSSRLELIRKGYPEEIFIKKVSK
jgi:hypothetical protein